MSRKLDSETEELLWAAAESDQQSDRDEFEKRFPHLRAELATRRVMVEVLRKSKPRSSATLAGFRPTANESPTRRLVWVPAIAVLLAALAFGGYQATIYFTRPAKASAQTNGDGVAPAIDNQGNRGSRTPLSVTPADPPTSRDHGVGERPPNPAPPQKLVVLTSETTLFSALNHIVSQGGVRLEILPGVEDSRIRLFDGDPNASQSLRLEDAIRAVERAGNVKILNNGPGAYLVFPGASSGEGSPFGSIRSDG